MLSKQSTGSSMHWVPKSEENRREEKDLRRGDSCDSTIENKTKKQLSTRLLEESPEVLNMGPCKNISQIQVSVI